MRVVIWAAGVLGIVACLLGQTPPDRNVYSVSGTVVNSVTGESLSHALVTMDPGQQVAFTGADGRFQFDGIAGGSHSLMCRKPGFADVEGNGMMSQTHIVVSGSTEPLTLKLSPEASVEGRVTDTDGQPLERVIVQAVEEQILNGHRRWLENVAAHTDEDGSYQLENLTPGRYLIRLKGGPIPDFLVPGSLAQRLPKKVLLTQYYPQGSEESSAQVVQIRPGEQMTADFSVNAVPGFRVSGIVGPLGENLNAAIVNASGRTTGLHVRVDPKTGKWVAPAVAAGSWKIIVFSFGPSSVHGEQSFDVRSTDVQNVSVTMQPLVRIPVRLSGVEEAGDAPSLQLQLLSSEAPNGMLHQDYQAQSNQPPDSSSPNGPLAFENVGPGLYTVAAQSFGPNCIDAVQMRGVDLDRDSLMIAAGAQPEPLDVSLRSDCATLQVHTKALDKPAAVFVLLVSTKRWFQAQVAIAQPGSVASFGRVAPGSYRVYAFTGIKDLAYADPDALKEFSGEDVTLSPNGKAEINVDVIQQVAP